MIDQREWLGHIEPNPMVLKLKELAEEYHRVTEIYDRKVCTGWDERDQCAMPQTTVQRSLVTVNATRCFAELSIKAKEFGISASALRKAISEFR